MFLSTFFLFSHSIPHSFRRRCLWRATLSGGQPTDANRLDPFPHLLERGGSTKVGDYFTSTEPPPLTGSILKGLNIKVNWREISWTPTCVPVFRPKTRNFRENPFQMKWIASFSCGLERAPNAADDIQPAPFFQWMFDLLILFRSVSLFQFLRLLNASYPRLFSAGQTQSKFLVKMNCGECLPFLKRCRAWSVELLDSCDGCFDVFVLTAMLYFNTMLL